MRVANAAQTGRAGRGGALTVSSHAHAMQEHEVLV